MKRTVIVLVAAMVVAGVAAVLMAADHTYVGADKCKMCHKVEFNSWMETVHAKATDAAKASTDRKFGPECLKCHATNSDEAMAGVQCEACHGPGSDFKKMNIMKDLALAKENGLIIPTQATCDGCHTGVDHSKKVSLEAQKGSTKAIHAKKSDAPAT